MFFIVINLCTKITCEKYDVPVTASAIGISSVFYGGEHLEIFKITLKYNYGGKEYISDTITMSPVTMLEFEYLTYDAYIDADEPDKVILPKELTHFNVGTYYNRLYYL